MFKREILSTPQNKSKKSSNAKYSNQPSAANYKAIIQRVRANPKSMTHDDSMVLQRTIGNQAVCKLMKEIGLKNSNSTQRKSDVIQKVKENVENEKTLQIKKENKTGLPDNLKTGVENLSGISMDDVMVHYNSDAPAQVGALAYTQGTEIHVAPGQERHLPHEAWHVVQQAQGRVQPMMQLKDVAVNDDEVLEKEADRMGEKAIVSINNYNSNRLETHKITQYSPIQRSPIRRPDGKYYDDRYTSIIMSKIGGTCSGKDLFKINNSNITLLWDGENYYLEGESFKSDDIMQVINRTLPPPPPPSVGAISSTERKPLSGVLEVVSEESPSPGAPISTVYLASFRPEKTNTKTWSADHEELSCAHHKLGKAQLAWMWEHMTDASKKELKSALHLLPNAEGKSLTRLTSNLISPKADSGEVAQSDKREDDPMNNSGVSVLGQEYLDLLTNRDGTFTPRSQVFFELAQDTLFKIYNRYISFQFSHSSEPFFLTPKEAHEIIVALRKAEALQCKIEGTLDKPSHSVHSVFRKSADGKFKKMKTSVPKTELSSEDYASYDRMASEQRSRKIEKMQASKEVTFKKWLACFADDVHEDPYELDDQYEEWLENQRKQDDD